MPSKKETYTKEDKIPRRNKQYLGDMMFQRKFTREEIDSYFYGRTEILQVEINEAFPSEQSRRKEENLRENSVKKVDIYQLRHRPGVEKEFSSRKEFKQVLTIINCIPPRLHLCYSSIPGAGFGINATDEISSGTWIGPYQGRRISVDAMQSNIDNRYIWEIYKNGVLIHGIDGSDVQNDCSNCWMKYIQCARNQEEQNTVAFQFGAEVYFQTYKAIKRGEEILVWYAEYYEQYYGIPIGVRRLQNKKKTTQSGADNYLQDRESEKMRRSFLHDGRRIIENYQVPSDQLARNPAKLSHVLCSPEKTFHYTLHKA